MQANEQPIIKATPLIKASNPPVVTAKTSENENKKIPQMSQNYNDDDDVRSGQNEPIRPKTSGPAVRNQQTKPQSNDNLSAQQLESPNKDLTPKERMMLNKLKKADEEAAKVGQVARENLQERMLRDTLRREGTIYSQVRI